MESNYYKNKESVEEYIKLAKDVSGEEIIEKLKRVLPEESKVLEIGSGPGTDWRILSQSYKVTGSDFSDEFLEYLEAHNPEGNFLKLDARTLETDLLFDAIYSNKVLQHLTDEELMQTIKRQSEILNREGIICHSFWKGEGTETFKGMLVNYHNEKDLEAFFGNCFDILLIEEYVEFDEGDSLVLLAKKKS